LKAFLKKWFASSTSDCVRTFLGSVVFRTMNS
jgi:hypothetical protein